MTLHRTIESKERAERTLYPEDGPTLEQEREWEAIYQCEYDRLRAGGLGHDWAVEKAMVFADKETE